MTSSFSAWLVTARGEAGLTQQELADETGVHVNTIKKLEAGATTRVSAGVAAKLRERLGEEADPVAVRDEYDRHTRAALDLIGAYLMRLPEGERLAHIFSITNYVLSGGQE
jgi:transcriptional regulator with XRE-family HTH domain